MALSTYAELKASIANWLDRADLTTEIADFITLAEARFNRELRTPDMEARATATTSGEYLALPAGFLGMRSIYLSGSPDTPLDYFAPHMLRMIRGTGGNAYTIADDQIIFAPVPASGQTVEMLYYASIPALSDSNTSNWLLASHPDLYLSASLAAAAAFIDDPRMALWKATSDEAMAFVNEAAEKRRRGSTPLVSRSMVAFS